jgi:hypothetical protein
MSLAAFPAVTLARPRLHLTRRHSPHFCEIMEQWPDLIFGHSSFRFELVRESGGHDQVEAPTRTARGGTYSY